MGAEIPYSMSHKMLDKFLADNFLYFYVFQVNKTVKASF